MSAAAPQQASPPEAESTPRRRRLFGRRAPSEEPRPGPKRRRLFGRRRAVEAGEPETPRKTLHRPKLRQRPRRPPSMAFYLTLFALLTGALAVALVYNPELIPGLAPAPEADQEPAGGTAQAGPTPEQLERAVQLARQQAELAALQEQLDEREAALQEREAQIAELSQEQKATERQGATLSRTARLLAEMPPYRAAPLLADMADETAVAILRLMTTDEAATILAFMGADRAAALLEAYAEEGVP